MHAIWVAILKERLAETNRNVDRSLGWLLDHEKHGQLGLAGP
jgi:hypothetical protein